MTELLDEIRTTRPRKRVRHWLALLFLLTVGSTLSAQAPFPGAVLVNGGWVPCNHVIAIQAGVGCVPQSVPTPPPTPAPSSYLEVGQIYQHIYGWKVKILAVGQLHSGKMVLIAEVLEQTAFGVKPGGLLPLDLDSPGWGRVYR